MFATLAGVWRYVDFVAGRPLLEDRASANGQLTKASYVFRVRPGG